MVERAQVVAPVGGEALWVFGDLIEIKITGEQTGGAYCLIEDWPGPAYRPPLHVHRNEDELVRILEGDFLFLTDDGETSLEPGSLVRIPKGTPHAFHNLAPDFGRRLVLFAPAGPERLWAEIGIPAHDRTSPPEKKPDMELFRKLAKRYGLEVLARERGYGRPGATT